MVSVPMTLWS